MALRIPRNSEAPNIWSARWSPKNSASLCSHVVVEMDSHQSKSWRGGTRSASWQQTLKRQENGHSIGLSHIHWDQQEALFPENSPKTWCVSYSIIWRKPARRRAESRAWQSQGLDWKSSDRKAQDSTGRKLDFGPVFSAPFCVCKENQKVQLEEC